MKRYQNIAKTVGTVEFENYTQFLSRGQHLETDKIVIRVSKGIEVTDLDPQTVEPDIEIEQKPVVKKKIRKKRVPKIS